GRRRAGLLLADRHAETHVRGEVGGELRLCAAVSAWIARTRTVTRNRLGTRRRPAGAATPSPPGPRATRGPSGTEGAWVEARVRGRAAGDACRRGHAGRRSRESRRVVPGEVAVFRQPDVLPMICRNAVGTLQCDADAD